MTKVTAADLLAAARESIEHITVEQASLDTEKFVFVDVRERHEVENGTIPGAVHAARGSLEFYLDPESSMCLSELTGGKKLIMVCATGGRAALATKLANDMDLDAVCLAGGFKAWKESGRPVR